MSQQKQVTVHLKDICQQIGVHVYRIVKMTNTVEFTIGQDLTESAVKELIERRNHKVIVGGEV